MLDKKRHVFKDFLSGVGNIFSRLPFTPNQYTIISVLFSILAAVLIVKQYFAWALLSFIIASFLDSIDGSVARQRNESCKEGAYLDTVIDRYVEGITLFSLLFLSMPTVFFPSYVWIFLALFGSITTTYCKAAAKEKDMVTEELKGGFFSRGERLITICLILFFGIVDKTFIASTYILIFMAVMVNITALQRVNMAFKESKN
jgi:phosphatidylglycerophosphate synthase